MSDTIPTPVPVNPSNPRRPTILEDVGQFVGKLFKGAHTMKVVAVESTATDVAAPADGSSAGIPGWMGKAASELVTLAESLFGAGAGADKKAWVKNALKTLAHQAPTGVVPAFIADPVEDLVIDVIIEITWQVLTHQKKINVGKIVASSAAADLVPSTGN